MRIIELEKGGGGINFTFDYTAAKATTLKRLLAQNGVSHRLFKRLLETSGVTVDGKLVSQNHPLAFGARVHITLPYNGGMTPSATLPTVVMDCPDWLIVDKPAGLTSVPGPSNPDDSLLNQVVGYLIQAGYTGPKPAIITRLDRDTTGLVLVAKHVLAQARLEALGVNHTVQKTYLAVVSGTLETASGRIDLPLGLAADGIHREVQPSGQQALTTYRVLEQGAQAALVSVTLLTGRTHQIRAHFAHLGHPLVGDALYGGLPLAPQQLLQASHLAFTDPFTHQLVTATLPLPPAWRALVKEPT